MGEKGIAEEDGLVYAELLGDGGFGASDEGFIEDIVMDECCHMDHFDDGCYLDEVIAVF